VGRLLGWLGVLGVACLLPLAPCYAIEPVQTSPSFVTGMNASGTIAVSATWQRIWIAGNPATPFNACVVQNNGTHAMFVFAGTIPPANGTTTTAYQVLPVGGSTQGPTEFKCNFGGVSDNSSIWISGTAADSFYANRY